jgi:hypothetical protein
LPLSNQALAIFLHIYLSLFFQKINVLYGILNFAKL